MTELITIVACHVKSYNLDPGIFDSKLTRNGKNISEFRKIIQDNKFSYIQMIS